MFAKNKQKNKLIMTLFFLFLYCILHFQVLAQATELLYSRIDTMNTSCFDRYETDNLFNSRPYYKKLEKKKSFYFVIVVSLILNRFVNWFSYHLSNFQFRLSWEDWESCLQMEAEHPRPKFIREVLLKAQRLSYHERIHKIVPESFQPLTPARPDPIFKYDGPDSGKCYVFINFND
jgi:nuclear cap-binding protein subunit 1